MKTYTVIRSTSGQIGCVVSDGREATVLRRCIYHSPTGFETGYPGSGPADLQRWRKGNLDFGERIVIIENVRFGLRDIGLEI